MFDQNNMPARTPMSHYLRTGRVLYEYDAIEGKQLRSEVLRRAISLYVISKWGKPNELLVDHYFFSSGKVDLVAKGLLPYITRARVFQRVRDRFLRQVQRDLLREAGKICKLSQEDYILGREKSVKRFQKKFSDKQSIDFTSAFFSLGNSYIDMSVNAYAEVNCITGGVSISGNITYEIDDWFRDALDLHDKIPGYQELPGGTAFKMVAHWSRPISLSGRFR